MDEAGRSERSWLTALRSVAGRLETAAGVLAALLLLPLIIGPFVVAYEFAKVGQHTLAALVGVLFGGCVVLALRAVRRGEFSPGVVAAALVLLVLVLFLATRLHA